MNKTKIYASLSYDNNDSVIKVFLITGIKYYKLQNNARLLGIDFKKRGGCNE